MFKSKKGQREGAAVAILIIVIALFMTFYILFIPPEERNQLLQTGNLKETGNGLNPGQIELLAESPGLVTPTTESAAIHRLPSVNVFLKEEPQIISLAQTLSVGKGLFTTSSPQLKFQTKDLDQTTKVTIFFSVEQSSGELRVKINGNTVYSEEVKTPGIKIVEIAKSFLQNDNILDISVSSPGLAFWQTNKYSLKDLGIKQEFERKNNQESRTFVIESKEKTNLKSAKLFYTQQCNFPLAKETTHLEILLNDQRVHQAEIKCVTTDDEFDIDSDLVYSGTNTLTFSLEGGDFSFNQLRLQTTSKTSEKPTYYFSLNQNELNAISSGQRILNLHLLLDANLVNKNAKLTINNNDVIMKTTRNTFDVNLRDYVLEGTNFIKIVPINSFNIVGLKVDLE